MALLKRVKSAWQKLSAPDEAESFTRSQAEEGAFESVRRGRQRVPLDRIVGSVGRYHDFDSRFRPKQHLAADRYEKIKQALAEGRRLGPVKLYQIRDTCFVVDGNHRIAAAKALGHSEIEADIVEFLPSKNALENLLYRQRAVFGEKTNLPYNITLTEIGQYDHLLHQITRHQAHLTQTRGSQVTFTDAAMDWYETIYRPLRAIIRGGNLHKFFPRRTLDDLYAYISRHQWEQGEKRKYGIGIDRLIPNNMEAFREKMADQHKDDYPEMLRQITAFVLLNIRSKNEARILDKLFALKEVKEVHVIHGNVDVLTKIVLQRNLLFSDAEIIAIFVDEQMRHIPGVVSTQTLIPGHSKIKTT